jgi:hypothetical protein
MSSLTREDSMAVRTVIVLDRAGLSMLSEEVDRKLVHPITDEVEEDMQRYVPVRTGALFGTIEKEHGDGYGRVWFGDPAEGVDYHLYVEYGTSRMGAQPYARPALYQVRG